MGLRHERLIQKGRGEGEGDFEAEGKLLFKNTVERKSKMTGL